jgi:hypothetical protein
MLRFFQTVCQRSNEFEKGDMVIINWTYPQRFRWAYLYDKQNLYQWKRLSANLKMASIFQNRLEWILR